MNRGRVLVVGDVTPATILPALEKTFGSWKSAGMAALVAEVPTALAYEPLWQDYRAAASLMVPVAAILDDNVDKVGSKIGDLVVRAVGDLAAIVAGLQPVIGVIATPASAAQGVANLLVEAGVTAILNFAPGLVSVPATVVLRKVDLALEIQVLSFYQRQLLGEMIFEVALAGDVGFEVGVLAIE